MTIEKIIKNEGVTISLSAKELCTLANAMSELNKTGEPRDIDFYKLRRDIYTAFEVMSHGHLDRSAVGILQELTEAIKESAR